jgi:hypothetical protein
MELCYVDDNRVLICTTYGEVVELCHSCNVEVLDSDGMVVGAMWK